MKKILISSIGIILLILIIISALKGFKIGEFRIYSVQQIKDKSYELDNKIVEAKTETEQNYPKSLANIDNEITDFRTVKEEYESKISKLMQNVEIGMTQIEKYKSEFLWVKIGKYATEENLKINIEVQETSIKDTYNINFTLIGSYVGITNFLYNIENDDDLNYRIKNFKVIPNTITTTDKNGKDKTTVDIERLMATFVVENIIIIN